LNIGNLVGLVESLEREAPLLSDEQRHQRLMDILAATGRLYGQGGAQDEEAIDALVLRACDAARCARAAEPSRMPMD